MKKLTIAAIPFVFLLIFTAFASPTSAQCGSNPSTTNTCTGTSAGILVTTGVSNSFFGKSSGQINTSGRLNSFFGNAAGRFNVTGEKNSFFGAKSGFKTDGTLNSIFGYEAGLGNVGGDNNAFFGSKSGTSNVSGNKNSALGASSNFGSSGLNYATAIGADAVVPTSNTIQLGRDGLDATRLGALGVVTDPFPPAVNGGLPMIDFTLLCTNADGEISDCNFLIFGPDSLFASEMGSQKRTIEQQDRLIRQQQGEIEALKNAVCAMNKEASFCRQ